MSTNVYITVSLDGYIARKDGSLDWLPPFDEKEDYGYVEFASSIDAIIMGRHLYEFVKKIDPWPYKKPDWCRVGIRKIRIKG